MQNVISNVSSTIEAVEQVNTLGMTTDVTAIAVVVFGVISFVVSLYSMYRNIDKRIDERIDARIKPSTELLKDTVVVVKNLEKNTAEISATLSILRELMLSHKNS